ncbi:hypothetical protein P3S67_020687 [Capsicum chacoense]
MPLQGSIIEIVQDDNTDTQQIYQFCYCQGDPHFKTQLVFPVYMYPFTGNHGVNPLSSILLKQSFGPLPK